MRIATYFIALTIATAGLVIGVVTYRNKYEIDETKLICTIIKDTFYDEKLSERIDGYTYGPEKLSEYLISNVNQHSVLSKYKFANNDGIIYDVWGGKIYVKKVNGFIQVRSNGPDQIRHTQDDIVF